MQWYNKDDFVGQDAVQGLGDVLNKLTGEFIAEFGIEDGTNFPEQIVMN